MLARGAVPCPASSWACGVCCALLQGVFPARASRLWRSSPPRTAPTHCAPGHPPPGRDRPAGDLCPALVRSPADVPWVLLCADRKPCRCGELRSLGLFRDASPGRAVGWCGERAEAGRPATRPSAGAGAAKGLRCLVQLVWGLRRPLLWLCPWAEGRWLLVPVKGHV